MLRELEKALVALLALTAMAQLVFPRCSSGSLVVVDEVVRGSRTCADSRSRCASRYPPLLRSGTASNSVTLENEVLRVRRSP